MQKNKAQRTGTCIAGILLLVFSMLFPTQIFSAEISISQINPGRLLTRQQIELYLSVLDSSGIPIDNLGSQDFEILESEDGSTFTPVPITGFSAHALDQGINFFLLIDNSGSMYETMEGERTNDSRLMRMTYAKDALRIFLRSMDDSRDRVQLASFNTRFHLHSDMISNPAELLTAVNRIERPEPGTGEGWTENYYSIQEAVSYLADLPGRNVLIMLSDGENFPYMEGAGEPHPEFGERIYTLDESIESLQRSGISLFAIRLGDDLDVSLPDLTRESGGRLFDTRNADELAQIYLDIRDQVLREYRLTYRAAMIPSEKRIVKARYTGSRPAVEAQRTYFAGTLFGIPGALHPLALIIPFLLAVLGLFGLSKINLLNKRSTANLEVLNPGSGSTVMEITQTKTVIGSADSDDITLVNAPSAKPSHATVIYNENDNSYTIESENPVKVNNQKTTERKLEAGDVINVGGTMVVFDDAVINPDLAEIGDDEVEMPGLDDLGIDLDNMDSDDLDEYMPDLDDLEKDQD